jgi:hypothetical protein
MGSNARGMALGMNGNGNMYEMVITTRTQPTISSANKYDSIAIAA